MYTREQWLLPLKILSRPIQGFNALKYESLGKGGLALLVLALQMLYVVVAYQGTGFLVNYNDPEQFNSLELIFLAIPYTGRDKGRLNSSLYISI